MEDRYEHSADDVFWVPAEAQAKSLQVGKLIDDAMTAIERENPRLRGVLPKTYTQPDLDKTLEYLPKIAQLQRLSLFSSQ